MRVERESTNETMNMVDEVLQKLPSGVVIVDKELSIVKSNTRFIDVLGSDAVEISEVIPGLVGADLHTLLPKDIYTLFEYVINENLPIENRDINFKDNLLNLSVFPIKKANIVAAVFRDMHEPEVRRDEVVNRVNEVIEKNLNMVQQIGFLLGEGAAETEKMLNSIIESFRKDKRNNE
jgi:transcriptional regulator with PAS, ATPase and Fis domain